MSTRLTIPISGPEGGGSMQIEVRETFDEVLNKLQPMTQPASQLEHRETLLYHLVDGRRIMIQPAMMVHVVEENPEDD